MLKTSSSLTKESQFKAIQNDVCAYVEFIVLPTVFQFYGMVLKSYATLSSGISWNMLLAPVFSWYTHSPKGSCVYRENTLDSYTTRKRCITSRYYTCNYPNHPPNRPEIPFKWLFDVEHLKASALILPPCVQNVLSSSWVRKRIATNLWGRNRIQFRFLGNCPPTPPLSYHFALSVK